MSPNPDSHIDAQLAGLTHEVDALDLVVGRLAGEIETASDDVWRTLSIYGRARKLLNRILGRAARHETHALRLARRMATYADNLIRLRGWLETVERRGVDPDEIAKLRAKVRRIESQIRQWGADTGP